MGQARGRQNGKAPRHKNSPRHNNFWACPDCGMKVTGTRRQVEDTIRVHNCGLGEDRTWVPR